MFTVIVQKFAIYRNIYFYGNSCISNKPITLKSYKNHNKHQTSRESYTRKFYYYPN